MPINPVEKDNNAIKWIKQLPFYLDKVINTKGFQHFLNAFIVFSVALSRIV